ncbi:MAG: glycoside hydrolase family 3 N-terminal domain-containing protein [Gemmatimonadota bacterium]
MHARRLVSVSLAVILSGGCAGSGAAPATAPTPAAEPSPLQPAPPRDPIDVALDSLSTRDKIAQIVMPWIPGGYQAFDDSLFTRMEGWVDSLHVGGLIISIGTPLDVAAKLNRLQQRSALPLLVASDLEGGTSFRLNGGTPFPTNMGIGAGGRETDAYEVGRITALEGRAVGIHLTFAPVADVNNNPANPIINTRSFGEDQHQVASLVAATIRGIQDHGMLATAKHFPGHGDTGTDSHIALPVITSNWARLDTLELVPFRAAIGAGVAVVMSAHIALPGIDSESTRPATLDPKILTGILRDSLGFHGVAVTDALNMGGIVGTYGQGEAAVLAFLAGADLLLQPADPRIAIDAMEAAVTSGRVSRQRLDASLRRVLELKRRSGLFARRTVPLDSVPEIVGRREFITAAREISERSIVLVADSLGTVDSLRAGHRNATVILYGDENASGLGATLLPEMRARGMTLTVFRLWPASGPASYDSARAAINHSATTIFVAAVRATAGRGTIALPDSLAFLIDQTALERQAVLVSLGSPYILGQTPHVSSYLLGWATNPVTEWAMARALTGQSEITGHLPITLPPLYPSGYGLQRVLLRMEPDSTAAADAVGH